MDCHENGINVSKANGERAIAYMECTVVDISIPSSSFKPFSLSLSQSPLSKTPKQVFFNPYFDFFTHSITVF